MSLETDAVQSRYTSLSNEIEIDILPHSSLLRALSMPDLANLSLCIIKIIRISHHGRGGDWNLAERASDCRRVYRLHHRGSLDRAHNGRLALVSGTTSILKLMEI
ncbi:hypothetical protein MRB53_040653 [Persea americana]|nr:hypothetical protein MRB53_040653 [Persea americana]